MVPFVEQAIQRALALANLLNVALDPIFIFG
jgi:hypothetical protein